MREIVEAALNELALDYRVNMIATGEKRNYEVIFLDRQTREHFTIRLSWATDSTADSIKANIRTQLQERLRASKSTQPTPLPDRAA